MLAGDIRELEIAIAHLQHVLAVLKREEVGPKVNERLFIHVNEIAQPLPESYWPDLP